MRDELTIILKAARHQPQPGWEARALAALGGVRPRRHPNLVTIIVVTLILLALAAGAYAAARFFVKGTIRTFDVVARADQTWDMSKVQSFRGDATVHKPEAYRWMASPSPDGKQVAWCEGPWPRHNVDIQISNTDGSERVNLTKRAGVGGVNCCVSWSPDGRMLSFHHADPQEGQIPCCAGWQTWLVNRDGSHAHQLMPEGFPSNTGGWTRDGKRLRLDCSDYPGPVPGRRAYPPSRVFLVDPEGKQATLLPDVGGESYDSPDGSRIVSVTWTPAVRGGRAGTLNRLVLTRADGSNPRVLVEQFIATADIAKRYPTPEQRAIFDPAQLDWGADISARLGPRTPVWSPDGKAIAFLAALSYDPDGIFYLHQIEVYVYDLTTDTLTRMTNDQVGHIDVKWTK